MRTQNQGAPSAPQILGVMKNSMPGRKHLCFSRASRLIFAKELAMSVSRIIALSKDQSTLAVSSQQSELLPLCQFL